jgi:hypothetical protein
MSIHFKEVVKWRIVYEGRVIENVKEATWYLEFELSHLAILYNYIKKTH